MENQHRHIKGYRDLNEVEVALMNEIKEKAAEVGALFDRLKAMEGLDQHWVAIGRTDAQTAFMAAVRAVAQPGSF